MQHKVAFVTGGCGFVGRHLVKSLLADEYTVWILDDLSTGRQPSEWLSDEERLGVTFIQENAVAFFSRQLGLAFNGTVISLPKFDEVFHLASVVGGRAVIEGNPMAVAIDLAIDALFFQWVVAQRQRIGHALYASSSAAYPVDVQGSGSAIPLQESLIAFQGRLGMPDMTYGWSKLTGEYLSRIVALRHGISIACVRPFSGYGGDQDLSYPIPAIAARVARREDPLTVWGTGEQGRDFVHIDDCITAMRLAPKAITDGQGVNIGTGILTTFIQVATLLAELAGYSPTIKPLIDKPVGVQSRYSDPAYMREVLDWSPSIALREGLARVLQEQEQAITSELVRV